MKAYNQFLGQFDLPNETVVFPGMEKKILINDLGHKECVPKQKQVKTQPPNSKKATAQPEMVVPAKPS